MRKTVDCKIISNKPIAVGMFEMIVACDTKWIKPGKFINVKVPGYYLRRPMGISDWTNNSFTFIYKIVGNGTDALSKMKANQYLNILIDLGNSFEYQKTYGKVLLVSGSSGLGPILGLAKSFKQRKISFEMVVGFTTKNQVVYVKKLKQLNPRIHICTDDGTFGEKGNVIDIINKYKFQNLFYYVCGATGMEKAIYHNNKHGQLSLDERMGCGFGACMGCIVETKNGIKRICKDGPIFYSEDLIW